MPRKTPRILLQTTLAPALAARVTAEAKRQHMTRAEFLRRLLVMHFYPKAKLVKAKGVWRAPK